MHQLDQIWSLVAGNHHSGASETHPTVSNTLQITQDECCHMSIRVNLVNGFWCQCHHQYFWMATYGPCAIGILIYQQSHLQLTDARTEWPVYQCSWKRQVAVVSCPAGLVRYWLFTRLQPAIFYQKIAKYSHSTTSMPPALSGRAIFPPHLTIGTSFERNSCLQSFQKYQINLTMRWIRRFQNTQLGTPIPCTSWGWLRTQS